MTRFEEVFALHRDKVFRLCRQVLGDPAAAEDALQETFLAVHRGLPRFREEARLSTWIYRIALRTALRVAAGQARRPASLTVDVPVSHPAPAETEDSVAAISRAIDALPIEKRIVLQLFALEELSALEIAEALGIPEGTVWSRLHAARKELAARLAARP